MPQYGLYLTYKELQCIKKSVEVHRDHYKGWDNITPQLLEKIDDRIKSIAPDEIKRVNQKEE